MLTLTTFFLSFLYNRQLKSHFSTLPHLRSDLNRAANIMRALGHTSKAYPGVDLFSNVETNSIIGNQERHFFQIS